MTTEEYLRRLHEMSERDRQRRQDNRGGTKKLPPNFAQWDDLD